MLLKRNLETPRLLIRPYQAEDRDFCVSLWCDKENGKYMSDPLKENIDQKYLSCLDGMEECVEKGDYVAIVGSDNYANVLAQLLIYYQAVPILLGQTNPSTV